MLSHNYYAYSYILLCIRVNSSIAGLDWTRVVISDTLNAIVRFPGSFAG